MTIAFPIRYFIARHHRRNRDRGTIFRRQIALYNRCGRTYRAGRIAEFDFDGREASGVT